MSTSYPQVKTLAAGIASGSKSAGQNTFFVGVAGLDLKFRVMPFQNLRPSLDRLPLSFAEAEGPAPTTAFAEPSSLTVSGGEGAVVLFAEAVAFSPGATWAFLKVHVDLGLPNKPWTKTMLCGFSWLSGIGSGEAKLTRLSGLAFHKPASDHSPAL